MPRWERPEDIVYMLYTGGTTGMPKGVMYNQAEFISGMFKTVKAMGYFVPDDMDNLTEYVKDLDKTAPHNLNYLKDTIAHLLYICN